MDLLTSLIRVGAALLLSASITPLAQATCAARFAQALPVLELYTSEGCSSCPPADRWLSAQLAAGLAEVSLPLAFHVDYWDYIGWTDRFADPRHAERQRARVAAAGGRVVYTPQLMLGEDIQLAERDGGALRSRLLGLREQAPALRAELKARVLGDAIEASIDAELAAGQTPLQAWLLLVSDGLSSRVSAGENKHRRLQHDRVVRLWQGPWALTPGQALRGSSRLSLPEERGSGEHLVLLVGGDSRPAWGFSLALDGCESPADPDR